MKVAIAINESKEGAENAANSVARRLIERGVTVMASPDKASLLSVPMVQTHSLYRDADMILVFGGDGTLLRLAASAAENNVPLFGINVGTVGFLTGADTRDFDRIADAILSADYIEERRAMLSVEYGEKKTLALNEAALSRMMSGRLANFEVYADDVFVDVYRADGFIVSTATGSTAYSLSAGGPILSPDVQGIVLTPVCAHSLRSRSLVVGPSERIKVRFDQPNVSLSIDGRGVELIEPEITVETAKESLRLIRLKDRSFYGNLLNKLNQWNKA